MTLRWDDFLCLGEKWIGKGTKGRGLDLYRVIYDKMGIGSKKDRRLKLAMNVRGLPLHIDLTSALDRDM